MNINIKYLTVVSMFLGLISCDKNEGNDDTGFKEISFNKTYEAETEKTLKNPYMGWALYSEGGKTQDNADTYWTLQDEAAQKYAGVFYVRWPWAAFEPKEGEYAWEHDDNFKKLIQGALDRGLRLAFRVTANSRDCEKPAIPDYVIEAGAEYYIEEPGHKNPYPDDPVFLDKYTKFIKAFGEKFNDPSMVDYVDCTGLGWWGEEHHYGWKNSGNRISSLKRIMNAYAEAFDKVIVVTNFERAADEKQLAFEELGLSPRRDGYASTHFNASQQKEFAKHYPSKVLIAEACYWGTTHISSYENGKWQSWSVYYKDVVSLALETHANYLDLRTTNETSRYLNDARDQVKRFVAEGGYRIYPEEVNGSIKGEKMTIKHSWKNLGVGVLPNNNNHLGYKYKVAFALFNDKQELIKEWYSNKVEVSELIGDNVISVTEEFDLKDIQSGTYQLAVGIVNQRENDSKDITLAIKYPKIISGEWVYVDDVAVEME